MAAQTPRLTFVTRFRQRLARLRLFKRLRNAEVRVELLGRFCGRFGSCTHCHDVVLTDDLLMVDPNVYLCGRCNKGLPRNHPWREAARRAERASS